MKTKNRTYTRIAYEIHTSDDGKKWYRQSGDEGTDEGLVRLRSQLGRYKNTRYVRIAHVTKTAEILEVRENTGILSQQQIDDLMEKGRRALTGIKGIHVSEGFEMSMSDLSHGPSRVTVDWSPTDVLGKCPRASSSGSLSDLGNVRTAKLAYNQKSAQMCRQAMDDAEAKLKAAQINFVRFGQSIQLKP